MLKGIAASQGIAIAKVYKLVSPTLDIQKKDASAEEELAKLAAAFTKTISDIEKIKEVASKSLKEEELAIFDAHLMMANDPEFRNMIEEEIKNNNENAEYAADCVSNMMVSMFESMDDEYMRGRAADIRDVTFRLECNLAGKEIPNLATLDEPVVIVAKDLTPSDTGSLNKEFAKGFATEMGGRTSHSAIMARSLEIPAVVGCKGVLEELKSGDVVVLDADLAGATKTGMFKKAFPERFIDCGIAEGNMIGVAAGIATTGKVPFASTFAMFAAGRAFEQVRNSVGYPKNNVKIGATHAGISVGEDGATHQCNEDIALMRTIPGMVVISPADDVEARAAVFAAYEHQGPVYMRFGRLAVPVINDNPDYKFEIGKGIVLREGKDVTIVATGLEVSESLAAAEKLAADGIDAKVINIHTIKPIDEELIVAAAKETGKVVTVEEHSVIGGLGSAVCDVLSEKLPTPVLKIGVMDTFGESGPAVELIKKYGLDADSICEKVKAFVK